MRTAKRTSTTKLTVGSPNLVNAPKKSLDVSHETGMKVAGL
jgi:hypothetical protein